MVLNFKKSNKLFDRVDSTFDKMMSAIKNNQKPSVIYQLEKDWLVACKNAKRYLDGGMV